MVKLLKSEKTKNESKPEVIKPFFMLDSAEHEFLNAYKYKNIKQVSFFRLR